MNIVMLALGDVPDKDIFTNAIQMQEWNVGICSTAEEALELMEYSATEVCIIDDRSSTSEKSLAAIKELQRRGNAAPILVITNPVRPDRRAEFYDAGAAHQMDRPFHFQEFMSRVYALNRRAQRRSTDLVVLESNGHTLDIHLRNRQMAFDGIPLHVTTLEFNLLRALASKPDQIITADLLRQFLYGYDDMAPTTNIVQVLVSRLRAKFEAVAGEETGFVACSRGLGYILAMPAAP